MQTSLEKHLILSGLTNGQNEIERILLRMVKSTEQNQEAPSPLLRELKSEFKRLTENQTKVDLVDNPTNDQTKNIKVEFLPEG